MEQDAQQRILEYFIEEASDHLNTMEQGLMELQNSDDPANVLRELFRGAHSVKGGAAMLGLQAILSISHQLEDYFNILQERQLHIDQELESYLLQGLDILKVVFYALPTIDPIVNEQCLADMVPLGQKIEAKLNNISIDPLEEDATPAPLPEETVQKSIAPVVRTLVHTPLNPDEQKILGYFIEEAQENLAVAERNLAALCTPGPDPHLALDELREELYRSFHSIKGGAAMLHLQAIRQIAFRLEHFCREVHKQPDLLDSVLNDYLGQGRLLLEGLINRLPEVNLELDEAALQAAEPLMIRIENKLNGMETVDAVLASPEVISAMEEIPQEEPELTVAEWLDTLPTLEVLETENVEVASAVEAMAQEQPELVAAIPEPAAIPPDLLEQIDEGIYALQECFIQPRFAPVREEILTLTQTLTELGPIYGFPGFERICQTLALALLRSGDDHWQEMGFRVLAEFQQAKALILQGDGAKIQPSSWLMACAGLQVAEELSEPETFAEEKPSELFEPEIAVAITEEVSELASLEKQDLTNLTLESLMSAEFPTSVAEETIEPQALEAVAEPAAKDPLGDILAQLFAPPQADFITAQGQAPVVEQQTPQETEPIAAIETSSESLEDLFTIMPEVVELERPLSAPAAEELAASAASEADMDLAATFGASETTVEPTKATDLPSTPVTPTHQEPPAAPPTARPARRPSRPERNDRKITRPAAAASSESRPPLTGPVVRRTMRVEVRHLDGLSNLVGELVINRNTLENQQTRLRASLEMLQQRVSRMDRVSRELEEYYDRSVLGIQAPGNPSSAMDAINRGKEAFDALEMDRYTAFHTISQEIMELIVRIKEASSDIEFVVDESDETSRQFRQISSQLQDGLNQIRMLPLSELVDRLPRAVRDLSINMGKEVELELLGRETLLDKAILEELYDPLTHLTTNALMHGIEPIEERRRLNKKAKGKITVSASHQGNQTLIAVKDDGRGLDARRIRAKAVERGLLTPEQAAVMTDSEVFPLIFLPGFTTVDQVTEIAGRGVGMDVVLSRLNRLRGNVLIDSIPGEGTTFTIRLPLTLSISRAILCRHGQGMIAFPLDSIDEMVELPTNRIKAEGKRRYILWRDRFIPFVPLAELLIYQRPGLATSQDFMKEKEVATVILRSGDSYVAVGVDAFIEEQEIVIKQLKGPVDKPQGLAGVTVLGNGQVMSIADVGELIAMVTGQLPAVKEAKPFHPTKTINSPSQPTVLIVDDSITVRELLSMTFTKAGYRVEQAKDGQEAIEKLKAGLACDMVFCDVEMPRMDGFEFLSQVQKDSRLNQIPVAMLTSRSADKHRQTAYQLGAKGYFTKPYLEEDLLKGAELLLKGGQIAMV
ncbi:MAG: Hpt domain-containing protein [Gloeobacterales cyanobacterium]